jgi:acyl-CoA synthetase (AMP-forming)/AMP-acid ligase II
MFLPTLLQDYFLNSSKRTPKKTAIVCDGQRWSYSMIRGFSMEFASTLFKLNIVPHDRVVIFLENSAETVIALYGTLQANGVFVIVNGGLKARKLAYILNDSGARFLITHVSKATVVAEAFNSMPSDCKIIWIGDEQNVPKSLSQCSFSWNSIFPPDFDPNQNDLENGLPRSRNIDQDLAALIYTSGSTGEPKGVMSTHFNMISAARSIIQYLENQADDIILDVLPLSFDYGLYQVIMTFMFGGTIILEKSFLYLHHLLKKIETEKVTGFPIVPTILTMLMNLKDLEKYNFRSLRYMTNTGAALPVKYLLQFTRQFPSIKFYSMFGLTECKRVSYLPPTELEQRPASVGKAMPNCEVFILNEDGTPAKPGEIGELVIRGSNVMKGYWNAPDLTQTFYRPGKLPGEQWLYSGDYFKQDEDGFLYFIGRKDEMIKCKGERISAKEIENALYDLEGVKEVAVIGVPDELLGQAIKVFIVRNDGIPLDENAILKYCQANLEAFMLPKYVAFLDFLPKNSNGKIDKKQLKQMT